MQLPLALDLPLARSIPITGSAAQQLLGELPLSVQLGEVVQTQRQHMLQLLGRVTKPHYNQPRSVSRPALLLLEGEHSTWPLLALAQGGIFTATQTSQHLRRAVSLGGEPRTAEPTLAHWLADALLSVAEALLLGQWGVLLTYASLQRQAEPHEGLVWLTQQLRQRPGLLAQPAELCVQVLWAAMYWLHGGETLPSEPAAAQQRVLTLVAALPTLPSRTITEPLPTEPELEQWLLHWLPALSVTERRALCQQWQSPPPPDDHAYLSGITALRVPGQVALWRRSRNELHVIVLASPAAPEPQAWVWQI